MEEYRPGRTESWDRDQFFGFGFAQFTQLHEEDQDHQALEKHSKGAGNPPGVAADLGSVRVARVPGAVRPDQTHVLGGELPLAGSKQSWRNRFFLKSCFGKREDNYLNEVTEESGTNRNIGGESSSSSSLVNLKKLELLSGDFKLILLAYIVVLLATYFFYEQNNNYEQNFLYSDEFIHNMMIVNKNADYGNAVL